MPSTSGKAKIERAKNQLENAERLIMGLPKIYFKHPEQRRLIEQLAREILEIKDKLDKLKEGE